MPTEAQWEKACRGEDGRTYPWGSQAPTGALANFGDIVDDTTPVGSYPSGASPYGALDMSGNVWEWTADWYDRDYYSWSPSNPQGPEDGDYRTLRGGAWNFSARGVRCADRFRNVPHFRVGIGGFRVVWSPGS